MKVEWIRAGDVLKLDRSRVTINPGEQYRQIGVYSWGKGIIERPWTDGAELSKLTYFRLPENSLVLSNIQAWEAAIALSTSHHRDFIASQRFLPYVPIEDKVIDLEYILHFLLSDVGMERIRSASPGTVTRNRTLGIKAFEDIEIPLPRLKVQRSIALRVKGASHLGSGDKTNSLLRAMNYVRQQLITPGPEMFTTRIPLKKLLALDTRRTRVAGGGQYPNVGLLNRGRGVFEKAPVLGAETKYTHLHPVSGGQLIYSKLFGWEGSVALVPDEFHGYFVSSEFPHFDIDVEVAEPGYVGHLVRSAWFQGQLAVASTGMGQRRHRVNVDRFLSKSTSRPRTIKGGLLND